MCMVLCVILSVQLCFYICPRVLSGHFFVCFLFLVQLFFVCLFFVFYLFIYLFIYFWLCWVFVSVRGLSLVAASGGHSSSRCVGLSLLWPLLLWSTGSRRTGSVVVAHGPSCSVACGIFPDQGSNPHPLHQQADSQPLCHQGSASIVFSACYHWGICFWFGCSLLSFFLSFFFFFYYLLIFLILIIIYFLF